MKKLMAILMVTAVSTTAVAVFADETPQTNKFPRVHVDPVPTTQAQAKNVSVVTEVTPSVSKPVEIQPVQEIEWTKVPLVVILAAVKADPTLTRSPAVFAALVSSLTEANAGDCFAALLAAYNKVKAQSVNPANTVSSTFDPKLWYESNYAPGGSRLWAIVQRAKFAAARGEDLTELHKAFLQTLNAWIMEDQ